MKDGVTDTLENATALAEKLRRGTNLEVKVPPGLMNTRRREAEIAKLEADAELVRAQARFTNAQARLQEQSAENNVLIGQLQKLQVQREIDNFTNGQKPAN